MDGSASQPHTQFEGSCDGTTALGLLEPDQVPEVSALSHFQKVRYYCCFLVAAKAHRHLLSPLPSGS